MAYGVFGRSVDADEVVQWRTRLHSLIGTREFPERYEDIKEFPEVDYDYKGLWKVMLHNHEIFVKINGYIQN